MMALAGDQGAGDAAPAQPGRLRLVLGLLKPFLLLAVLTLLPVLLQAAGFIRMQALLAWREASPAPFAGAAALSHAADALRALPSETSALAAEATQEGHWRFLNRAGETVTAGTPEELARVPGLLLPEVKPPVRLTLLLTPETLLERRNALAALPAGTQLRIVVGPDVWPVILRPSQDDAAPLIEVRPNVLVEARERDLLREALWQLGRPVDRAGVRILALEVGGPSTLAPQPRKEKATGRPLIDVIDPASLAPAFGSVRGQTLVVTGRVERDVLYVQPSSGAERGLRVRDLLAAADAADVNLVILESASTPRQPGGRNWLWQRVEVKGLEEGLQRTRLADVLNAVGGSTTRFLASVQREGTRTQLQLKPALGLPRSGAGALGEAFMDAIGDLTGRVVTTRVEASLRSSARQRELDRRLLPFVPALAQAIYAALLAIGLIGWRPASAWWSRLWPREDAAEYANAFGYQAARALRGLAFVLAFLPIVALAAAAAALQAKFKKTPEQRDVTVGRSP